MGSEKALAMWKGHAAILPPPLPPLGTLGTHAPMSGVCQATTCGTGTVKAASLTTAPRG